MTSVAVGVLFQGKLSMYSRRAERGCFLPGHHSAKLLLLAGRNHHQTVEVAVLAGFDQQGSFKERELEALLSKRTGLGERALHDARMGDGL